MTLTEFLLARIAEDATAEDYYSEAHLASCVYVDADWMCDCGHPARIRREYQAKRLIVEACERKRTDLMRETDTHSVVMRALAAVYADHPDYREEWKP